VKSSDAGWRPPAPPPAQAAPPDDLSNASPQVQFAIQLERTFAAKLQEKKPWGTWAIVALCGLAYLIQASYAGSLSDVANRHDFLFAAGTNMGNLVVRGQLWRLGSCTFLHGGLIHIGGNMWALWVLGPFIEKILGTPRFLVLYGLCGIAGSVVSASVHPAIASIGASGAIWGLMTAAFGLALRPGALLPPFTARNMKSRLIQPLIINVGLSLIPGVDAFAHLGGGVAGFLLMITGVSTLGAVSNFTGDVETKASRVTWIVLAAVVSLAMVACLAVAVILSVWISRAP